MAYPKTARNMVKKMIVAVAQSSAKMVRPRSTVSTASRLANSKSKLRVLLSSMKEIQKRFVARNNQPALHEEVTCCGARCGPSGWPPKASLIAIRQRNTLDFKDIKK